MISGLYTRLIGIAIIVAACLGAWWYVSSLRSTITALKADNITLIAQGEVLAQKIKDQNAAADVFKADADNRLKAADAQLAAAKADTVNAKARATTIYKTPPSTPGNDCMSALDMINGVTK
jgi:ArsR family metal-binding transcriptional regulator